MIEIADRIEYLPEPISKDDSYIIDNNSIINRGVRTLFGKIETYLNGLGLSEDHLMNITIYFSGTIMPDSSNLLKNISYQIVPYIHGMAYDKIQNPLDKVIQGDSTDLPGFHKTTLPNDP